MPVAILISQGEVVPAVLVEKNADSLLQTLNALATTPALETVTEARVWLMEQPDPSGWFDSMSEANAYFDRLDQSPNFAPDDVKEARAILGLTRENFAEKLGYGGNSNTRHKTIFDIEKGRNSKGDEKKLNVNGARRLRALLARHATEGV
jgi:DNA-binding XRE family transcriptional regulator